MTQRNRKIISGIPAILLVTLLAIAPILIGCDNDDGGYIHSIVHSVQVNPSSSSLERGATLDFVAIVTGPNNPPQTVTWSVSAGGHTLQGTNISADGQLTIGTNEVIGRHITITVTSVYGGPRGTANVTVIGPAEGNETSEAFNGIITSISYGNGRFVAGGWRVRDVHGIMAFSDNGGASWTTVTNTTFADNAVNAISYGSGRFVAVGGNILRRTGWIAHSNDGANWTAATNIPFGIEEIQSISYGGGRFVAGGQGGRILFSDDGGETWIAAGNMITGNNGGVFSISFSNGIFIAVGGGSGMAYSNNGATWSGTPRLQLISIFEINSINAITYGGGRFVVVGNGGRIAFSDNGGQSWGAVTSSVFGSNCNIWTIHYGGGRFVASSNFAAQLGMLTAHSNDGVNWTAIPNIPNITSIRAISHNGSRFVAGGHGRLAFSDDGINWTTVANPF